MTFNPTAWGAPMGPSAPQTPGAPGENPILAALARAIGNNPAGPQFSGGGSLNYGQPPTPTTMPTAFSQPPAPTQDYDTQIQQNQMRQRLAMSLMQNQTRGGPFAALSNAIAGYYGAKNYKGAEKGELDIAAAKKADEAAKYGALAKQFGLEAGGLPIDSPQMLQLASALSGQKYAQENPPLSILPEGGTAIDRTGKVVGQGGPKPPRYVSGGAGSIMNEDTGQWLQGPGAETKAQTRAGEAESAVATDAAKEAEKSRTIYRTAITNAAGSAAKLQRDLGQVEDLFKKAEADGLQRDDLFGPITGNEYVQRFGAAIGKKAVGYQEALKRLMDRMTLDTLSMQSGKNMRLGGGPMIELARGTLPDLTTSKYDSAKAAWDAVNEEAQQTRDMFKMFNKEFSANRKLDPNDFEDRYMSSTLGPSGPTLTEPGATDVDQLPATAPEGTKATDTKTGAVHYFRGGKWVSQ